MAYLGNQPASGPTISLPLGVADGGTGSTTADVAKSALQVWTTATGGLFVPAGTTAQRDTPTAIKIRYNNELSTFEGSNGSAWGSIGGGAKNDIFYENAQTVTASYTISGKNAMTAGPITVADGVDVTVSDGCVWTIV